MAGESAAEMARRQRARAARLERSAEAWEKGACGERLTGEQLDQLRLSGWVVYHDVRWPGRARANIDHVAVGPQGVFVIDTKNWSGGIRVVDDVLYQGGRRREREVAAAAEAGLAVTQHLGGAAATPVLCFAGGEPLNGWARDVMISSVHEIVARLRSQPAVLSSDAVRRLARMLDSQFVSASRSAPGNAPRPHPRAHARIRPLAAPPRRVRRRSGPITLPLGRRLTRIALGLAMVVVGSMFALPLLGTGLKAATSQLTSAVGGAGAARNGSADDGTPALGTAVRLPAAAGHPAVVLKADKVVRLRPARTGYPLQTDQHLVAVRYTIRNLGDRLWGLTPNYLQLSMLTSNGQSAPHASYSTMPGRRLLPAAFNLEAGRARRGFVVFAVANGSKPVRVSAALSYGSGGTATWLIP